MDKKIPYIDPDNAMSPEDMERFMQGGSVGKPVVEMREGEVMPLAIYSADLGIGKMYRANVMMSAIHRIADDTIQLRGRIRDENTGDKRVIEAPPVKNTKENYQHMIGVMKGFVEAGKKDVGMKASQEPMLLEFEVGEHPDSILAKMERSNRFNIGVMPMDKHGE